MYENAKLSHLFCFKRRGASEGDTFYGSMLGTLYEQKSETVLWNCITLQ